jgi:predicted dithiol-disulfide oxidoreductase (DUF899 family)
MSLPQIVSREQWLEARRELLTQEKELTRRRDALSTRRRELPMVAIDKDYRFEGPDGEATLLDLFAGNDQLLVNHFMFDPSWDDGCPSCSAGADEIAPGLRRHLEIRGTRLVYVSRAPLHKIEDYKARRGWTFPWYSSSHSDFNYDFHVTLDESVAPLQYNYRPIDDPSRQGEWPGLSAFLRVGESVFHTYSSYARGAEWAGGSYALLDLTALGRQEEWEEPKGRAAFARAAEPNFKS